MIGLAVVMLSPAPIERLPPFPVKAKFVAVTFPFIAAKGGPSEIMLFLDPGCQFFDGAVKNLNKFSQQHPELAVKVFINGPLKDFLVIGKPLGQEHPQWVITNDLTGGNAHDFGVTKVPAYVLSSKGKFYRVYGTPDLNNLMERVNEIK